jgi:hypothetical protein
MCSGMVARRWPSGLLAIAASIVMVSDATAKLNENCRRITIEGDAGPVTNVATWYIYDNSTPAPVTLAQSCPMQPLPDVETSLEYMRRLAYRWGDDPVCPPLLEPSPQDAGNKCVDLGSRSCKIKYKISPKGTGAKKRYLEFCCYNDNVCKDKLISPYPVPITVIVDRDGAASTCPADNCVDDCADCTVDVDPIAMRNLPTGPGATCRDAIAKAVNSYTNGITAALTACHDEVAAGDLPSNTDCNSTSGTAAIQAAAASLAPVVDAATAGCATFRTPVQMGYGSCETPCESVTVAGWTDVADCLRCRAEKAATATMESIFGPTPGMLLLSASGTGVKRSVSTDAQDCQSAVTKAITNVVSVHADETAKCQKKIDAGAALPAGVPSCADTASKKLVQAEGDVDSSVSDACGTTELTELSLCDGAADASSVAGCVSGAAKDLTETVAEAAIPNGNTCLVCQPLAETGMSFCYTSAGVNLPCEGTGQDAETKKGLPRSYTDNGDGTVTDNVTGLVWEKLSDDGSIHDRDDLYTWAQATSGSSKVASLNTASFAGHGDWRLPTIKELQTLVDYGKSLPALDGAFNNLCAVGCDGIGCSCSAVDVPFWSANEWPDANLGAFYMDNEDGWITNQVKTANLHVRAVRGGSPAARSYADNGNGTITDNVTGLTWEKLSDDGSIHDKDTVLSWDAAFTKVMNLNEMKFAGYEDWRLPNVSESFSLWIPEGFSPAFIDDVFRAGCAPGCSVATCSCAAVPAYCWTSTTSHSVPSSAWAGAPGSNYGAKSTQFPVRAVRGGL